MHFIIIFTHSLTHTLSHKHIHYLTHIAQIIEPDLYMRNIYLNAYIRGWTTSDFFLKSTFMWWKSSRLVVISH